MTERVKEAMEWYGYSQREVATVLGKHYSTVSRLPNRKKMNFKWSWIISNRFKPSLMESSISLKKI